MTKIKSMGKIVAVSVMSAIVSVSFNGCGFFGSSTGKEAESCEGEGVVTIRELVEQNTRYVNTMAKGECKNGLKEGLWKYYNANDNSELIQEVTFASGIRNGITRKDTTEYYINGKMVGEIKDRDLYLYEKNSWYVTRYRKYNIYAITNNLRDEYNERVKKIEWENKKIEVENNKMLWEAREKAPEIARQRAESKVKKPTMQEVKKSKSVMDTYRANLKAQEEKELQIELSKIQALQTTQKQTQAIPQYKAPKLDTYEGISAFVEDKKHTIEECAKRYDVEVKSSQDSDGKNFKSDIQYNSNPTRYCTITNDTYKGDGCWKLKTRSSFKETIEKSIFKDKFNAILP